MKLREFNFNNLMTDHICIMEDGARVFDKGRCFEEDTIGETLRAIPIEWADRKIKETRWFFEQFVIVLERIDEMNNITAYEDAMDALAQYKALGYTPNQLEEIIKERDVLRDRIKNKELKAKDVLVVRCNSYLKPDMYKNLYESIQNQQAMGLVLLPSHLEAIVVPSDIEIKIEGEAK